MPLFLNLQAAKKAGLSDGDVQEILQMYTSQPIKDKLKNTTEHALSYGVGSFFIFSFFLLIIKQNNTQNLYSSLIFSGIWLPHDCVSY